MSVRRLADASVQPPAFAFNDAMSAQVQTWIGKYPEGRQQSAVIPLLMLAQEQEGWVTKAAIESVADMLGMPRIRALEVATFYTQFQLKPVGSRAHVQVCGTTPCMLRGSEALLEVCRDKIHHDQFHLNASGTLSWEEVECLGACVNAPMVMIFKDTYEDLTPERLGEIIDAFERGEGADVPVGPQNGRFVSAPVSGQKTLTDEQALIDAAEARKSGATPPAAAAEPPVPPSKAAKPASDAIETSNAVNGPSPVKADRATEGAGRSVAGHDAKAADRAEPQAEGESKPRRRATEHNKDVESFKAPELLKGEPIGPNERRVPEAAEPRAPEGVPLPEEGKSVGNTGADVGSPDPDKTGTD